jgi:hypothetical protein
MPHRRKPRKGSFGSHFDELVVQFPPKEAAPSLEGDRRQRPRKLQEKVDIHSALFERARNLDRKR